MGGYTGKYSRSPFSVFDEEKNYLFALMQEGIPVTDDDENDGRISTFTQVRRMAQLLGDYGTPNNAFIVEEGAAHAVDSFTATDTITLEAGEGDVSAQYPAGRKFTISGSTAGTNDGTYTVSSATSATPTVITTVEVVVTQGSPSPATSTLNVNNFELVTSQGPANADIELAGRFFMRGIMCLLLHDVDYNNDLSDLARQSIHPRVTNVYYDAVSHTVVEDSAANWVVGELIGRTVLVDGNGPFTITSNTADEFEIATDVTASIANGNHYILELSTPGVPRTDDVYLNVYVDEYDSTDDPALEKNLGGNAIEAQLRAKVIQTLFVREDNPMWGNLTDYVDSNGNQHFVFKLATLARSGYDPITQAEITSHTPSVGFNNVELSKLTPLRASAKSPAAATVFVVVGQALSASGDSIVTWAGGDSPTFANTHASLDRIDVLVLKDDGTLGVVVGTAAGSPVVPAFYGVPIAIVAIASTGSAAPVINSGDITDARTLYTSAEVPLRASTQFPTANTVYVAPGQVLSSDGMSIVSWAGGASPTFPVVVTNPRKDMLVLRDDGTLARIEGDEDASPVAPKFFGTPIAIIDITETSSVIVDADDLTDARVVLTPAPDMPMNYIGGLITSNGTDTQHDIDIAPGVARSEDDLANLRLSAVLTKQIDATWAVGDDEGGMESAFHPVQPSTLYALWLIKRSDTSVVDALFSESFTAPTLPTDYDSKRLIAAVVTSTGSNIVAYVQSGDYFRYLSSIQDVSDSSLTSGVFETGVLSVPPKSVADFYGEIHAVSAADTIRILTVRAYGSSETASRQSAIAAVEADSEPMESVSGVGHVLVDAQRRVEYAGIATADTLVIILETYGFLMCTRREP